MIVTRALCLCPCPWPFLCPWPQVLERLEKEKEDIRIRAWAANERPPDNSYASIDEYLKAFMAKYRRGVYVGCANANRGKMRDLRLAKEEADRLARLARNKNSAEAATRGRMRWKQAKNAVALGISMTAREESLRTKENLFLYTRRKGVGARV